MSVALIVKDCNNLFGSGINQQVIYTCNLLRRLNYNVEIYGSNISTQYLNIGTNSSNYYINTDLNKIKSENIKLVICVSDYLDDKLFNSIKNDKHVVYMICGNYLCILHEAYIFNNNKSVPKLLDNKNYHEIWTFGMYKHMIDFLKTVYKTPVSIVPYVWDNQLLLQNTHNNIFNSKRDNTSKANIIIIEPNLSTHKSSFVPLVICEQLMSIDSTLINKIFLINGEGINSDIINRFINIRDNIEIYSRINIYTLMSTLNTLDTQSIFLSHNINNELNFVFFEIIECGWKLVHNSPSLMKHGFYYDGVYNISDGVRSLKKCIKSNCNEEIIVDFKTDNEVCMRDMKDIINKIFMYDKIDENLYRHD